jgi:RHS repeat-associated protein
MVYPNGRILNYNYGASGSTDDIMSRVQDLELTTNSRIYVAYTYLGAGVAAAVDYPEVSVKLDYQGSGNSFSGFDRFGRVVDQKWQYDNPTPPDSGLRDEYRYGYDCAGNVAWKENVKAPEYSGKDHFDEAYEYDALDRLINVQRGNLSGGSIVDAVFAQDWGLDALGNFGQFKQDDNGGGTGWELEQTRTVNEFNEIDSISGGGWATPEYDAAGNMTTAQKPSSPSTSQTCKYDAWNRLVEVKEGASVIATYSYDGSNRRVTRYGDSPAYTRHYYFDAAGRVLEERKSTYSSTNAEIQYVWGVRYVDDLVCRDRDNDGNPNTGGLGKSGSGLDERYYTTHDANWNVTALVSANSWQSVGFVYERYVYDPYGKPVVYEGDFDLRGSSNYAWTYLSAGRDLDMVTGFYYNRARWYNYITMQFVNRDPILSGPNPYAYCGDNPVIYVDPSGLWGRDVHYELTKAIAEYVGISCPDEVAEGTNRPDTDYRAPTNLQNIMSRLPGLLVNVPLADRSAYIRKAAELMHDSLQYHFPMDTVNGVQYVVFGGSSASYAIVRQGIRQCDFTKFSEGLHPLQDAWSHGGGKPVFGQLGGHPTGVMTVPDIIKTLQGFFSGDWNVQTATVNLTGFFAGISESADKPEQHQPEFIATARGTFQEMITFADKCGSKCPCPISKQLISPKPIPRTLKEFDSWLENWYKQKYNKELKIP